MATPLRQHHAECVRHLLVNQVIDDNVAQVAIHLPLWCVVYIARATARRRGKSTSLLLWLLLVLAGLGPVRSVRFVDSKSRDWLAFCSRECFCWPHAIMPSIVARPSVYGVARGGTALSCPRHSLHTDTLRGSSQCTTLTSCHMSLRLCLRNQHCTRCPRDRSRYRGCRRFVSPSQSTRLLISQLVCNSILTTSLSVVPSQCVSDLPPSVSLPSCLFFSFSLLPTLLPPSYRASHPLFSYPPIPSSSLSVISAERDDSASCATIDRRAGDPLSLRSRCVAVHKCGAGRRHQLHHLLRTRLL